jgi:hypothetical protein
MECSNAKISNLKEPDTVMSACASQTFSNITPDKWTALQAKAAQNNISLNGDSGQTTQQGFTFSWQYDAASASLTIQCLEHPFWAPCGVVNGRVHDLVDAS